MNTTTPNEKPATDKRFSTLAARAALAGHTLEQVGAGYVLAKLTYSKHCADLATVETLVERLEGVPA